MPPSWLVVGDVAAWPVPAIVQINEKARKIVVGGKTFTHKDVHCLMDGSTGEVMEAGTVDTQVSQALGRFCTK
jgi:hypothetical protein